MPGQQYGGICLVYTKEGLVRTDMPDGTTQELPEAEALNVIAQRIADVKGITLAEAKELYGID